MLLRVDVDGGAGPGLRLGVLALEFDPNLDPLVELPPLASVVVSVGGLYCVAHMRLAKTKNLNQ